MSAAFNRVIKKVTQGEVRPKFVASLIKFIGVFCFKPHGYVMRQIDEYIDNGHVVRVFEPMWAKNSREYKRIWADSYDRSNGKVEPKPALN